MKAADLKLTYRYGFCVYCGVYVHHQRTPKRQPLTCTRHRDLPARDPLYADPGDQWANAR